MQFSCFKNFYILKAGLLLFLSKIFLGFPNYFQVFKDKHFWSIFSVKLSLRLKTVLKRKKTLKGYCKATLNVFFKEKKI